MMLKFFEKLSKSQQFFGENGQSNISMKKFTNT